MIKTITIAAAALLAIITPSNAVYMKASMVNKSCQAGTPLEEARCVNFIIGTLNGIEMADKMSQLTPAQKRKMESGNASGIADPPYRLVCVPDSEEVYSLVGQVRTWMGGQLKMYPSDGEFAAADLIYVILKRQYPCK